MQEIVGVAKRVYVNPKQVRPSPSISCGPRAEPLNVDWVLIELYRGAATAYVSRDTLSTLNPNTVSGVKPQRDLILRSV